MSTLTTNLEESGIRKAEQAKVKDVALNMLKEGICCSIIAKCTGLSREDVKILDSQHECNH